MDQGGREAGRLEDSEVAYEGAIEIYERTLGPEHPRLAATLDNYGALLRELGRDADADEVEARAEAIRRAREG